MRLASIAKARTLAFIEINELNLHGKLRLTDCIAPIVERFKFDVFPTKLEDFDLEKGVRFASGKSGELIIDEFVVYSGLMYVETLRSTEDSKKVLLEFLDWGVHSLGLTYSHGMIRQWAYISDVVFHCDFDLMSAYSQPLNKLSAKTTTFMEGLFDGLKYQPLSFAIGHDPTARKNGIASLTIGQRANIPISEHKYFSEAPLPTDIHIKFLEEFESDVRAMNNGR